MPAKMKLGSKWSIVRKDVVKETPAFVNFTKNVMALAAAKYQEELESLCDLFGSSTMYTTGKVSMEIPVLGHQIIKSKDLKGQEKGVPETAAMPAPRAVDLDSTSSESDDDGAFWANRRKGLVLQKEDNLGDFVPMSETPPPPEPVTAHTDTAPERPPSAPVEIQEAAVETAYEGAPAGLSPTLKKWNSKMMQKKIISLGGNSMAEQKLKALQKRAERERRDHQNDAPLHASEVEDEDGEEGEEAEEQAQVSASGEQLTEEEQIARAEAKVAEKKKKRQEAETARWLRMNPKERVAAASKLALQQATQSLIPMLGHPDLSQTDELFSIMSTGLALLDDPRGAINALTDFVCSLGGEHWEDLIERIDLGAHNAHLWSDQHLHATPAGTGLEGHNTAASLATNEQHKKKSSKHAKGRTHLIQSPGGTRYPVDTTQAPYQDKTHKRPQEHPWETPQGTPKKERVLLQDETRPTPPTLKTLLSHKSVNTPNARDKGKAPEVTAANKGLDGVFKTAQEASLDAAKHINMIAGIHSALPVTMMYEETYRDELCEPGQVFYKLPHIERCALGMKLESLSRMVLAIHLIKSSNFPYGICSYEISSQTVMFMIMHGSAVHTLFRAHFLEIIEEDVAQFQDCVQLSKQSRKNGDTLSVIVLRQTWAQAAVKIRSLLQKNHVAHCSITHRHAIPWSTAHSHWHAQELGQTAQKEASFGVVQHGAVQHETLQRQSFDLPSLFQVLSPPLPLQATHIDKPSRHTSWESLWGESLQHAESLQQQPSLLQGGEANIELEKKWQEMQPSNYFFWPAMEISSPLVTVASKLDTSSALPIGALSRVATWTANCVFDVNRALNAHKTLDRICHEQFFEVVKVTRPSRVPRQNPFAVIRDTNEDLEDSLVAKFSQQPFYMSGKHIHVPLSALSARQVPPIYPLTKSLLDPFTAQGTRAVPNATTSPTTAAAIRGAYAASNRADTTSSAAGSAVARHVEQSTFAPYIRVTPTVAMDFDDIKSTPRSRSRSPTHARSRSPTCASRLTRKNTCSSHLWRPRTINSRVSDLMILSQGASLSVLVRSEHHNKQYQHIDELHIRPSFSVSSTPRTLGMLLPLSFPNTPRGGLAGALTDLTQVTNVEHLLTHRQHSDHEHFDQRLGSQTSQTKECRLSFGISTNGSTNDDSSRSDYMGHNTPVWSRNGLHKSGALTERAHRPEVGSMLSPHQKLEPWSSRVAFSPKIRLPNSSLSLVRNGAFMQRGKEDSWPHRSSSPETSLSKTLKGAWKPPVEVGKDFRLSVPQGLLRSPGSSLKPPGVLQHIKEQEDLWELLERHPDATNSPVSNTKGNGKAGTLFSNSTDPTNIHTPRCSEGHRQTSASSIWLDKTFPKPNSEFDSTPSLVTTGSTMPTQHLSGGQHNRVHISSMGSGDEGDLVGVTARASPAVVLPAIALPSPLLPQFPRLSPAQASQSCAGPHNNKNGGSQDYVGGHSGVGREDITKSTSPWSKERQIIRPSTKSTKLLF